MIDSESYISGLGRPYIILRPGGLVDIIRHPAQKIKEERLKMMKGNINLVDTRDVSRFIVHCLKSNLWNNIFNLVFPYYPLKSDFYHACKNNLSTEFKSETSRIIDSNKAIESGFEFIYDIRTSHIK